MKKYIKADIISVEDENPYTLLGIALDTNTRPGTLAWIITNYSDDLSLRRAVLNNPNTPTNILREYALPSSKIDVWDSVCVAGNPSTPANLLRELVNIDNVSVLAALARNPNSPEDVLRICADSSSSYVRGTLLNNFNAPLNIRRVAAVNARTAFYLNFVDAGTVPSNATIERGVNQIIRQAGYKCINFDWQALDPEDFGSKYEGMCICEFLVRCSVILDTDIANKLMNQLNEYFISHGIELIGSDWMHEAPKGV